MLKHLLIAGAMALALCGMAKAQTPQQVVPCVPVTATDASGQVHSGCVNVTATNPLPVTSSGGGGGGAITAASGSYAAGALSAGAVVDLLNLTGTKAAGTAATNSLLAGSIFNSSPITLTNGQQAALQSDASGYLNVHLQSGALTANQSVNTAQVNGVTTLTGAGATGTGAQRVGVAQDTTTIAGSAPGTAGSASGNVVTVQGVASMTPVLANPGTAANWGVGATGAAPAANAVLQGVIGGGATGGLVNGLIQADSSVAINVATATTTQLVALSAGRKIYVTALDVIAGGTGNITFEYGTGSTCGTGTTTLTGAYNLTAQAGIAKGGGLGPILVIPAGNALCVLTTAAVQMSGSLAYAQF